MVREWTAPQRTFLVNNQKQDMVIRAVRKMKERAQACVAVGGGVSEGRKL